MSSYPFLELTAGGSHREAPLRALVLEHGAIVVPRPSNFLILGTGVVSAGDTLQTMGKGYITVL